MRLTFIAHGTPGMFGDTTQPLPDVPSLLYRPHHNGVLLAGPGLVSGDVEVIDELRGPDMGEWSGLPMEDVAADPLFGAWTRDPAVRPPGGESLVDHRTRIGAFLDSRDWPEAGSIVVANPLTVRAACVHALSAAPETMMHLDVAPGTQATVTRGPGRGAWHLRALVPSF